MKKTLFTLVLLASAAPAVPALAQSAASPYTSAVRYDAMRRVTGTIQPDPDGAGPLKHLAVRNSYDSAGRLVKVESGELSAWQSEAIAPASWAGFTVHQTVDTAYDALDRKVKETLSGGGTIHTLTQYSYDALGRLECTAVRMNPAVFGSPPASACLLGPQGSFGPDRITKNVHDAAGQLVQVREGVGTSQEAAEATYSYTPNGKREYVTDANGNKARLAYDGHDRLGAWYFPSKAAAGESGHGTVNYSDFEFYEYDANGNRIRLRRRDGQNIFYSYDALNRVTGKELPQAAKTVSYGYDLRGLQTGATFLVSGLGVTNVYDNAGRLVSTTDTTSGTARTLSYLHDANGNRTRITHPDGVETFYDYDGLDRVKLIREWDNDPLASFVYDTHGRRSSLTRLSGTVTSYAYDAASRLSSLVHDLAGTAQDVTLGFGYNPASQIVSRTTSNDAYVFTGVTTGSTVSAINGLNQIATNGGTAFAHDANGNLTDDGPTTFAYDTENRLISASGAVNATLAYDPLGRLHSVASGGSTRYFLYDGDALVAEYGSASALTPAERYVHGPGVDEPLVWYGNGARRFLHTDHLGSIVAVSDDAGALFAANRYDEYGIAQGGTLAGRFGYTGQAWLPEIGRYYYKTRIYWPEGARFHQVDTIGYEGGINLYEYANSDPVNLKDPEGTLPREGSQAEREYMENLRNVGENIAKSPTKVDDAILLGSVGALATGTVIAVVGAEIVGGLVAGVKGLGNPFRGKTTEQAARMMERKGFQPRGPNPASGKGGYINPRTGRSYHVDSGKRPAPRKSEPPHVDVNRDSKLTPPTQRQKRKFPLED